MNASAPANPSSVVEQLLARRGWRGGDLERFLRPSYDEHLHDPFLLTDMEPAVARIVRAVEQGEQIVIYGDYDIDGITASVVMLETIQGLGGSATSYIPDRFEEGYGVNLEALQKLRAEGAQLVVTVDCGVTSVREIEWANANGLDVVVTDHHSVPEAIPAAIAVINPKRPGDRYPFKDLAGVGVAFKLAQALQQRTGKPAAGQEKWLLDMVALGTVCDVVTLVDENRVLVKYGLLVMAKTRRIGLRALANVAGVELATISSHHLGFMLGPRMNAAGRLEHASASLDLMLTRDETEAQRLAETLDDLNRQRREEQQRIFEAAVVQAEQFALDPILVLADVDWSHGVVGIVASKLTERLQKPALVMQILGEEAKGSARSYGGYNLVDGLRTASSLFTRFGGHHFAAGYTLPVANIAPLRKALIKDVSSQTLSSGERYPSEVELPDLTLVDLDLCAALDQLEPLGNGNPVPVFSARGMKVRDQRGVGAEGKHLKLKLVDAAGRQVDGIGFGQGEHLSWLKPGILVDAEFQIRRNEYNGRINAELTLTKINEHKINTK